VRYGTREDLSDAVATEWAEVNEHGDFAHQHHLAGLKGGRVYYYAAETRGVDGGEHAPIKGRFKFAYSGEGEKRRCKVSVTCADGEEVSYESPEVGKIPIKNSPLWKGDPDQQLAYYSSRAMCRRHFPDVILGVYTPDEMEDEPRDVTAVVSTPHFLPPDAPPALPERTETPQDAPEAGQTPEDTAKPSDAPETGSVHPPEDMLVVLRERCELDAIRPMEVSKFLVDRKQIETPVTRMKDLPDFAVAFVLDHWQELVSSVGGAM